MKRRCCVMMMVMCVMGGVVGAQEIAKPQAAAPEVKAEGAAAQVPGAVPGAVPGPLPGAGVGAELFRDADLPMDRRVADLISRLTVDEKISQLQETSPPIARLEIEGFQWWSEGIHGLGRAGRATVFPVAIALAACWDAQLMHDVADATSTEARAKYNAGERGRYHGLAIWAPSINLIRDPRWGRDSENYSEDPYLTARLGVAFCEGLQGDDERYLKTAATPKHFAVHSQETARASSCFNVSMRQLREYYLPAFRACYEEAHAVSSMAAFNGINGAPCTANKWLLTDLLRDQWGFKGVVVTDWGAVMQLKNGQHLYQTEEEAVAAAIKSGVDVVSEPKGGAKMLRTALDKGLLSEQDIDKALTHAMTIRFRLGLFDPKERVPYTRIPITAVGSTEHLELALRSSRESIVLLKNEAAKSNDGPRNGRPLLPLDRRRIESIAVFGPDVDHNMFGDYSGSPANPPVTPLSGIINNIAGRIIIRTAPWKNVDEAIDKAAASDVVIAVLGLNLKIEHEGHDRKDMDLPRDQQEFIEKIVAVNPNVIVVLVCGSPVTINWIQEHVPAIVMLWYPGEQGGNALTDVLLGDYNPAGRLPLTFYKSLDQLPPLNDYDITQGRTYMYLKTPPLYPFGFGLSYTTFAYDDLKLDQTKVAREATDGKLAISCRVTNTGQRDGDEVTQLYVRHVDSKRVQPLRELKGFMRQHIPAGQSRTVTFELPTKDLADWDEQGSRWFVEPGEYEIEIGASSADIRLRQRFSVNP
ncbi:MAG: glycoside hydrolase family 3 C-terminal domain-containing protein [Phycisphaerales bacterium]